MGNYTSIERLPLLLLISLLRGFSDMIRRSWFDLSWCDTASTNTNFSFSSQVFFFLQVLWKFFGRGQTETIRGLAVFLIFYLFFHIFLFWRDWHSSRKPILREVCIHANISPGSFFMPRLWRRSMNLNNAIYFIQDLENTGKKRIKFLIHKSWRTEKVIGKNEIMSGKQIVTQAVRPMYPINGVLVLLCIWGQFSSTSTPPPPRGAYIQRGDLTEGFLRYEFGGFIFGGAYTWRGLSSEFYGMLYYSQLSHSGHFS